MKDYRNLSVWQKSHHLALTIYQHTTKFPTDERFGLTSQIRRASVSIPANIAEGCGRGSNSDFNKFLRIAMGSASELDYHLMLSRDLHFLDESAYDKLLKDVTEIKRMLASLINKVKTEC